jgi:protein-tyrosine kinase
MERLKQAMERARAERQALGKHGRMEDRREDAAPRPTKKPKTALRIEYTRTATVPTPPSSLRDDRIILTEGADPVSDSYKVLRTQILQRMRAKGLRTLIITSPGAGEGKTTTAINLAISLARDVNQTVLLVDLDLRRPAIARYFGIDQKLGIGDYLGADTDLADIMFNPAIERLVILPGSEGLSRSSEILSSPRFVSLVSELKSRYEDRIILFDMPPLFASDDVIAFLPHVDAALLVVEDGKISQDELQKAAQLLGEKGLGIALNKTRERMTTY